MKGAESCIFSAISRATFADVNGVVFTPVRLICLITTKEKFGCLSGNEHPAICIDYE